MGKKYELDGRVRQISKVGSVESVEETWRRHGGLKEWN
jgi:hypothetical protein